MGVRKPDTRFEIGHLAVRFGWHLGTGEHVDLDLPDEPTGAPSEHQMNTGKIIPIERAVKSIQ